MFSHSLCLKELEEQAAVQPVAVKVSTPKRSIDSDSDIIEESPTNHSSYLSFRERRLNKSKASNKKRKGKSFSTSKVPVRPDESKFLRSDIELDLDISKLLPENKSNSNTNTNNSICDIVTADEKASKSAQKHEDIHYYESDMFSEWIFPHSVNPSQPLTEIKAKNNRTTWGDSDIFNDFDMNFGNGTQEEEQEEVNDKQQMHSNGRMAFSLDNVTFSENVMYEDLLDPNLNTSIDMATSKLIEDEVESFKNSFMDNEIARSQMCTLNFNNSGSSFALNHSNNREDREEKPVTLDLQSLKQLNSIESWGKLTKVESIFTTVQQVRIHLSVAMAIARFRWRFLYQ